MAAKINTLRLWKTVLLRFSLTPELESDWNRETLNPSGKNIQGLILGFVAWFENEFWLEESRDAQLQINMTTC